jgi:two-component system response regulator YesN
MRKILVVDDEKLIRLGVKSMLERRQNADYKIDLCQNGKEALKLMDNEKFDIIITDIRMPEMDGLTLLQNLKSKPYNPQIIILSGYDDFNYAVEALKCGAKDYLLKPIQREQLYASIDKVEMALDKAEDVLDKEGLINSFFEDFQTDELNYIFLKDNISEDEIIDIGNRIKLSILEEYYYVGLLLKSEMNSEYSLKDEIKKKLEEYVIKTHKKHISIFENENGLIVISNEKEVFTYIEEKYSKEKSSKLNIGLSDKALGIIQVKQAYRQALEASKYRLFYYHQDANIINYSSISTKSMEYEAPLNSVEKLGYMIGTDRESEIEKLLSDLLNENKIRDFHISYLELINKNINEIILNKVKAKFFFEEASVLEKFERFNNIYNFNSFKEYYHELKHFIIYISEYIRTISEIYGDRRNIDKAIDYINNSYYKDLNLATVSNLVSLNYSYFSQLFKEQTGENFVNYLKKVRINKAKELLKNGELKIYEVAQKVGYEDSKQFAKIFRSITGVSPIEYRDSVLHSEV